MDSPKKPALIEAMALNLADNADAKMETMTEILRGAGDNMGWLGYNRFMETMSAGPVKIRCRKN